MKNAGMAEAVALVGIGLITIGLSNFSNRAEAVPSVVVNAATQMNATISEIKTPLNSALMPENSSTPGIAGLVPTPSNFVTAFTQNRAVTGGEEEEYFTIHALCESGDATPARIKGFLALGVGVNSLNEKGQTPLHLLAGTDTNLDALEFLLQSGANLKARDKLGMTPLFYAASNNRDPEGCVFLIRRGAEWFAKDNRGALPLHLAAAYNKNPEVISLLIKIGADVNTKTKNHDTPLHYAATNGNNPKVLEALLKAGADVNTKGANGSTPLIYAVHYNKNPAIVTFLIDAGADVNARSYKRYQEWDLRDVAYAKAENYEGGTPLHYAAAHLKTPEVFKKLIQAGADVNAKDDHGMTPLITAVKFNKNPEVVATLIKAGADVNAEDKEGFTPIYLAARDNDNPEIIAVLLKAGGNVNGKDEWDFKTPLYYAARYNQNPEILTALLKAGGNVNASSEGWTLLHFAADSNRNPEVIKLLIKAGIDVNARTNSGLTPLDKCETSRNLRPRNAEVLRAAGGKRGKDLAADGKRVEDLPSLAITVPASAWKEGEPIAIQGLDIRTRRPQIPITSWLSYRPTHHPVAWLAFDRAGKPKRVSLRVRSQEPDLDERLVDTLYRWRAKGDLLANLAGDQTVTIEVRLLLN